MVCNCDHDVVQLCVFNAGLHWLRSYERMYIFNSRFFLYFLIHFLISGHSYVFQVELMQNDENLQNFILKFCLNSCRLTINFLLITAKRERDAIQTFWQIGNWHHVIEQESGVTWQVGNRPSCCRRHCYLLQADSLFLIRMIQIQRLHHLWTDLQVNKLQINYKNSTIWKMLNNYLIAIFSLRSFLRNDLLKIHAVNCKIKIEDLRKIGCLKCLWLLFST